MADKKAQKDLILRDFLAVDRTRLANQRTLLSMIRTGLYLVIMGLSVLSLETLEALKKFAPLFFLIGLAVIVLGAINYRKNDRKITEMYQTKRA